MDDFHNNDDLDILASISVNFDIDMDDLGHEMSGSGGKLCPQIAQIFQSYQMLWAKNMPKMPVF